jgi:hypothetical protein
VTATDDAEYLVDRLIGWQRTVEYGELSLETLRYVVSTTAWLNHGRQELKIDRRLINKQKSHLHEHCMLQYSDDKIICPTVFRISIEKIKILFTSKTF